MLRKEKMLPHGLTEKDFTQIVDKVARSLSKVFKFGFHDSEDIKQTIYVIALEQGLPKWDGVRPLGTFLYSVCHNALYNQKRKHYSRLTPPCNQCPLNAYIKKGDICTAYDTKEECSLYYNWSCNNAAKKTLMDAINIMDADTTCVIDENREPELDITNLFEKLDKELPVEIRPYWLKLYGGETLKLHEMNELKRAVYEIVGDDFEF